tara:strand:- start:574 stop:2019 length:1446 start_codon:yes stop_codon:yes gene_type:complete
MDKKLLNNQRKNIQRIINKYDAYLVQDCDNFKNFTGRDIDAFYNKKESQIKNTFQNSIITNRNNNSLRIHINNFNKIDFLSLDLEELSTIPKIFRDVFKKYFNKIIFCKKTKLNHLDKKSIIFYKLYKYFFVTIHSNYQLSNLKKQINKLNDKDLKFIQEKIDKVLSFEIDFIKEFLNTEFGKFIKKKKIKKFFSNKISKRHKKRNIFAGKLNYKKVFLSKKFLYALFFGSNAKWDKFHNPMPSLAIIGNDGSGKTTVVEYIRNNFSKIDPLIFDMKFSNPFFLLNKKIVNSLKKLNQKSFIKNIFFIKFILSIIGETLIFIDNYVKYRIGMAWADAGMGLTIFERYPTDRIRGEFPNKKHKFLPLEQFFPFPDGLIYLDVTPKNSIERKKKDNHTLAEMISKRKNYLSLLKEFDNTKIIKSSKNIKTKILEVKNYIFDLNLIKKKQIKKHSKTRRIKWKKNYNRILAGKNLDRSQKNSLL